MVIKRINVGYWILFIAGCCTLAHMKNHTCRCVLWWKSTISSSGCKIVPSMAQIKAINPPFLLQGH